MITRTSREDVKIAWLLLQRSTLRQWITNKWSYLLIIAIVAIGVGSINGIRQASRAASANFGLFNEAVSGRSEFLIEAPVGPIREAQLFDLTLISRSTDLHMFPILEGPLTQLNSKGEVLRQLRLIGLDLISVANLPDFIKNNLSFSEDRNDWSSWLGASNRVWVSQEFLVLNDLVIGEEFVASVAGNVHRLSIAGVLGNAQTEVPDNLVIADLTSVQEILSRNREIDRIELILNDRSQASDPDALENLEAYLRAQLPQGLSLSATSDRAADRAEMTKAFRLNLTILSLIAIVVGAYLILQALDSSVVRRRSEIATFKTLGVSSRSILICLLFEAGLIGIFGSLAGIILGHLFASVAVHILADTVNALYFATSVESIQLTTSDMWIGGGVGLFFSLLAGWLPARDAMLTPPAQILTRGDWSPGFKWLRTQQIGLGTLILGSLTLLIPAPIISGGSRLPIGGFLTAGLWIFSAALLSGGLLVCFSRFLQRFSFGAVTKLAFSRLADGSSRHRLAVAGLVVSVGMVTGMLQMVGSFRGTIEKWFDVRFQAELYVAERGSGGASALNGIDPVVIDSLCQHPDIIYADTLYLTHVEALSSKTVLIGIDYEAWSNQIQHIWHTPPGVLEAQAGAEPAYVSETFARRFNVLNGGIVRLKTPVGIQRVSPTGIYTDYGNEFGAAAIDKTLWSEWTQSYRPTNTSLYLKEPERANEIRDLLRLQYPGLDIRNTKELREVALNIFEDTFRVTTALNAMAISIALAGLILGIIAIFAESSSTWRTLTRLGFPFPYFIWTAGLECAGIAFIAWIAGTVVGLALGWLLIYVINVQSFGWTLIWELPLGSMFIFGILLVISGLFSGLAAGFFWHRRR